MWHTRAKCRGVMSPSAHYSRPSHLLNEISRVLLHSLTDSKSICMRHELYGHTVQSLPMGGTWGQTRWLAVIFLYCVSCNATWSCDESFALLNSSCRLTIVLRQHRQLLYIYSESIQHLPVAKHLLGVDQTI